MKNTFMVITLVFLLCFIVGCQQGDRVLVEPKPDVETSESKNTLEGVWERVEARFTTDGKTESPTRKAIKMFTKNHWVILEQEPNRPTISPEATYSELLDATKTFEAFAGTYTLEGDTLTESIEFASPSYSLGISLPFQIRWEGDRWIQTGRFPSGAGFGENETESYEVWKRIE